jgi:uncharacterized protein (TIGR02118 family)
MSIAHMMTFVAVADAAVDVLAWFAGSSMNEIPGLERLDIYTPEASEDPYLDDGPGPVLMVQSIYADESALAAGFASEEFNTSVAKIPAYCTLTHDAMRMHFYPVEGEQEPAQWLAPLSYVVRYHKPAEDEQAFIDYYVSHHPQMLGRFAGIRNVMCYLPIEWDDPTDLPRANYLLGNEVVFDSIEALNDSLASELRDELREDFNNFPAIQGHNTHYAMTRVRVV